MTGRISKFACGASDSPRYKSSNREHVRRKKKIYLDIAGDRYVPDHFTSMLSRVCHPPPLVLSASLHISVTLQGTKVLDEQELRHTLVGVTEGTPRKPISFSVMKYTGTSSAPEWMDIELGRAFSFDNFVSGTQAKQTSLRGCVVCRQISLLHCIRQRVDLRARCARHATTM